MKRINKKGYLMAVTLATILIFSATIQSNIISAPYPNSTTIVPGNTDSPKKVIEVPIKVNVLKNVNITLEAIAEIVHNANLILNKSGTGIRLSWERINQNVSDGGNDDGELQDSEREPLWGKGIDALNHEFRSWLERLFYPNKGRGYKVYIANGLPNASLGQSLHKATKDNNNIDAGPKSQGGPVIPVSFIKNSGNVTAMGIVLAHEFCHAMTEGGHSSNISNLMYPTLGMKDTKLNEDQIAEIRRGAQKQGSSKGSGSWINIDTKRAMWTDPLGDVSQEYVDLFIGSLFAEGPTFDLEVEIELAGLFPDVTDVNSRFEMGFDTDNNTNTGYYGVDKILRITLQGNYPFIFPNGSMIADLYDVASETSVSLTSGQVVRVQEIVDPYEPPIPEPSDYLDSIEQLLPLSLLGPLADVVPVNLWATNLDTGEYDWTSFQFDFNPPPGASIEMEPLEASPGQTVNVRGIRFPPLSTVTLFIDDTEILRTTTLDDGTFSISYTVPDLSPGWYFVTAVSDLIDSLDFDYSILTVPSTTEILYGSAAYPIGLITIDTATGAGSLVGPFGTENSLWGLEYDPKSDTLYGVTNDVVDVWGNSQLLKIDRTTGVATPIGGLVGRRVDGLAYDSINDKLYGVDDPGDNLVVIDTSTGAGTVVGSTGFPSLEGLAFNPLDGKLYSVDVGSGELVRIDPSTGSATAVASINSTMAQMRGLSFDRSGTLYGVWIPSDGNPTRLVTIDTSTGQITDVGSTGYSSVEGLAFVYARDVAVTNVTSSKTVVGQGYSLNINVTVVNQGNYTETFNITLYADKNITVIGDEIIIGNQTVPSLTNGTSTTIAFIWNTTSIAKGNYTIWAYASPVANETDTADNKFVDGWMILTIPGDVDGDGKVTILDVVLITSRYATKLGDPRFSPNRDIDGDGVITILDVVICTSHYAQIDP